MREHSGAETVPFEKGDVLTKSKQGFKTGVLKTTEARAMTKIFNRVEEKPKRRALRNEMTKAERIIWSRLSRRQIEGARFLRQYSVEHFVLDFYCPELKLAIEIDGATHFTPEAQDYDAMRQTHIEQYGIRFLRFTNDDVYYRLNGVVEKIRATVQALRAGS